MKAAANLVIDEGRQTFRFETFGDEAFWGDTLQVHKTIEGSAHGGGGAGVSPKAALSIGLKVDSDQLPASLISDLQAGKVNLDDPAVTLQLLALNAVVGVKGTANSAGGCRPSESPAGFATRPWTTPWRLASESDSMAGRIGT